MTDKKTDIWMPLYIGDYLADTSHLSTVEHGAYLLLLMHYWRTGPLPDDDRILARICKLHLQKWHQLRGELMSFFEKGHDGLFHQSRMDRELTHWNDKKLKAKEKAVNAINARWGKRDTPSITTSIAPSIQQVILEPYPSPSPLPINTNTPSAEASVRANFSRAEEIYQAYPKHVAKQEALKAIDKAAKAIKQDDPYGYLLEKARAFAKKCRKEKTEEKYIPYPATWFNRGSYDDENLTTQAAEHRSATRYRDPAALYAGPEYASERSPA